MATAKWNTKKEFLKLSEDVKKYLLDNGAKLISEPIGGKECLTLTFSHDTGILGVKVGITGKPHHSREDLRIQDFKRWTTEGANTPFLDGIGHREIFQHANAAKVVILTDLA